MGSYRYPALNDERLLRDLYIAQQLSTNQIARLVGVKCANSVRQALLRLNIPVRSVREGLIRNRAEDGFVLDRSVIDGCLLGDGCLGFSGKPSEKACPYFKKRNKHEEHVSYVARQLFSVDPGRRVTRTEEPFRDASVSIYTLRSLSHPELRPYYARWYGSGKKRIPDDLVVDATLLLHWFLDDGSSYRRRPESSLKQIVIYFSSECFRREEQDHLCAKINAAYDLHVRVAPCNSGVGHRIVLPQSMSQTFFTIIGPPPVAVLAYKWK